ncbi:NAD-dependent epimerase/dehydratase family protein [Chloroflexota bacterium]
MTKRGKVVITGIAGRIGSLVCRSLADTWDLSGVDIRSVEGVSSLLTDINDKEALIQAFEGASAVVHLAAYPGKTASWDDNIKPNILGTQSVFEVARLVGVKKVVFASSNHVTGLYENDEPYRSICAGQYNGLDPEQISKITHTWPIRPDSPYGVGKAFGEALGRYYAEAFGIETLCLRIGSCVEADRPIEVRHFATLLAHSDCASLINACLCVKGLLFDIFYGVSANTWHFWDTSHARDVLGWIPRVNAERFR